MSLQIFALVIMTIDLFYTHPSSPISHIWRRLGLIGNQTMFLNVKNRIRNIKAIKKNCGKNNNGRIFSLFSLFKITNRRKQIGYNIPSTNFFMLALSRRTFLTPFYGLYFSHHYIYMVVKELTARGASTGL